MSDWFRIPPWCSGKVAKTCMRERRKASDVEAAADLLGRWHDGENPGIRELMADWGGWRGEKTVKFRDDLAAWGRENGAKVPASFGTSPNPKGRTGTKAEHGPEQQTEQAAEHGGVVLTPPYAVPPEQAAEQQTEQSAEHFARASSPCWERDEEEREPLKPPCGGPTAERSDTSEEPHGPPDASGHPAVDRPLPAQQVPLLARGADVGAVEPGASKGGTADGGKPKKPKREHDPGGPSAPVMALWQVYRGLHAHCAPTPSPDNAHHLKRILRECGDLDTAVLYVRWAAESEDVRARQLRGLDPWPSGETRRHSDPESLSRHISARLPDARAWEARQGTNGVETTTTMGQSSTQPTGAVTAGNGVDPLLTPAKAAEGWDLLCRMATKYGEFPPEEWARPDPARWPVLARATEVCRDLDIYDLLVEKPHHFLRVERERFIAAFLKKPQAMAIG